MRKLTMAAVFITAFCSGLAHAQKYGMAGCGLGSLVIKSNDMMQIFAATSNGTSGNQTFGITSGTSNCVSGDQMAALVEQEQFIKFNFATLSKEIAQGGGKSVTAFSETLGCQPQALPRVEAALKANYHQIFKSPGVMAALHKSKQILKQDEVTAASCKHLII